MTTADGKAATFLEKVLVCFLAFTLVSAASINGIKLDDLAIVKKVETIDHQLTTTTLFFEEDDTVVLSDHSPFFGVIGQGSISVQAGLRSSFRFDYRINGVTSRYLAESDGLFRSVLNESEKILYSRSRHNYGGDLNVPFLRDLGMNLDQQFSQTAVQDAVSHDTNYSPKAIAARKIMESFRNGRLRVNGSISAVGVSETPSMASVYVKVSRMTLIDETTYHVVSSSGGDVLAGDGFFHELPIDHIETDITQEDIGNPLLRGDL